MVKKHSLVALVLMSLMVCISCSKKEEETVTAKVRPADISVQIVKPRDIKDMYTLPGVAEAWEVVSVPVETAGPVRWIGPSEGDYIEAGKPILRINTETLASNLESARVQLEARKKDFNRSNNMFKQQSVSQKSFDDASDALKLAEVSYKIAKDEFEKGVVKSPVAGIIDSVAPKNGEYVTPGSEAVKIVRMDKLKIYISVPERDVQFLNVGQKVAVYPADISGIIKPVEGVVNYISVTSDPKTLTYKARVDVAGGGDIRPGRIVRTDIVRRDLKNTIVVDLYTIVNKDGKSTVFVEEMGKARQRDIVLGPMIGKSAVIYSGLNEGEKVIVSGQQFLSHDALVRISE